MSPGTRKFALTTHTIVSVGWIGAVLAYLALVLTAMSDQDHEALRAVWSALYVIGWYVIVPLAIAALGTGLIMALGTAWGLFRHYWVVTSLLLTVVATAVLLTHMSTVTSLAGLAAKGDAANVGVLRAGLRGELLHAGLGVIVLLAVAALNVYKPRGMTAYGLRAAQRVAPTHTVDEIRAAVGTRVVRGTPLWVHAVWIHAVVLMLLFAIFHLAGGGFRHG
ncbi:MAG TPA: hypothetical protein VF198_07895 [Vicinamibacterales bacterium]